MVQLGVSTCPLITKDSSSMLSLERLLTRTSNSWQYRCKSTLLGDAGSPRVTILNW